MTTNHPLHAFAEPSAGSAPSLDPQETKGHFKPSLSFRAFYTSGIKPDVDHAENIYRLLDDRDGSNRITAFLGCKSDAWFARHSGTGKVRIVARRCGLRWCPVCIRAKTFVIKSNCTAWVLTLRAPKFATFTLKHSSAPLDHQINSLYDAFRRLRKHRFFVDKVDGGVWFFQVKRSKSDGCWHPHIHCLLDASFLDQKTLSDAWAKASGGSKIVDIRAVKDAKKSSDYVARYAAAPCRLSDFDDDDSVEIVDALFSRRICGTWGTGKAVKLSPSKADDLDKWEYLGGFSEVMAGRHDSDFYREVYDAYVRDRTCYAVPDPPKPPPWADDSTGWDEPQTYRQMVFEFNGSL